MKIGIIGAIDTEIALYLENMKINTKSEYIKRTFYEGTFNGKDIVISASGMGKVNAAATAQAMISKYKADCIIVSGVAGGMDKSLHIGDTVIADKVYYHDLDLFLFEDHPKVKDGCFLPDKKLVNILENASPKEYKGKIVTGTAVTGDAFIETDGREEINAKFSPMCTDMETAAIAHICFVYDIPFAAVRSISDTEDESGFDTFEVNCKKAARSSYLVVESIIEKL